jgi:hypothetical protein
MRTEPLEPSEIVGEASRNENRQPLLTKILFGHQPSPELLAILLVYVVQGILGISRLAVSFFLKDELALSPAEVAALMGIAALPWVIKPLFGFISDGLPILGYKRRPYLILSGLGCGCLVVFGDISTYGDCCYICDRHDFTFGGI